MKINQLDSTPRNIRYEDEFESHMTSEIADDVIEIFQTPLTGTYNWDYTLQDNRIKKLYELGKELNWNANIDVDWSKPFEQISEPPWLRNLLKGFRPCLLYTSPSPRD